MARDQILLFAPSIEAAIAQDNEIRLIDMFVDSIKLAGFGFKMDFIENGTMAIVLPHGALLRKIGNSDFSAKTNNYYNLDVIISVGYRVAHWRNFVP